MAPRFGTDGIRGEAGTDLTVEIVRALGAAAARTFGPEVPILVGRDTRESGPALEAALAAGIVAGGGTPRLLGVLPTPGLALACVSTGAAGAMISASHNPYSDNGVKLFEAGGRKLRDRTEAAVEAALADALADPPPAAAVEAAHAPGALDAYVAHLVAAAEGTAPFAGLELVVDTGNGAASVAAPVALRRLGASVDVLSDAPDGRNINAGCGSTYPDVVAAAVVAAGADIGLAFDGDADRVVAVDGSGSVVDGDHILAILAIDLESRGLLRHHAIATTVMANLGLTRALTANGIDVVVTPVGDRHVLAALEEHDLVLGGEQSGHVIAAEHSVTGDGPLTGVLLIDAVVRSGRTLAELAAVVTKFPQVLENVHVRRREGLGDATEFWAAVRTVEDRLGEDGRVLVRPSGTEPVVRVMVEARDGGDAQQAVEFLTAALVDALG